MFKIKKITEVAKNLKFNQHDLILYGDYIAKIKNVNQTIKSPKLHTHSSKLILISAISPTPMGEGKTTISIGLLDAFYKIGKTAALSLREPSMGPVFGKKGGATGAGKAQIAPANEINLHFTGDLHAITYANNLLCALVDNHIHQNNALKINPATIKVKRCVDINDRALRHVVIGLGAAYDGTTRQENFTITAASELMAILCLATNYADLKQKISNILIGFSYDNQPIFLKQLKIQGAIAAVLQNALLPNLVQTLEGNPVFVHGGPFANIAHGCCSITATQLALNSTEFAITEAGFGADLGAEKFCNIKCRYANLTPSCVVVVATVKALIYHGKTTSDSSLLNCLEQGLLNLKKHITNLRLFNLKVVVAINKFADDSNEHLEFIKKYCSKQLQCACEICDVFNQGGLGAITLAQKIVTLCTESKKEPLKFKFLYDLNKPLQSKIETICKQIYGAQQVIFSSTALKNLEIIKVLGFSKLPICVCKTPYELLPNKNKLINQQAKLDSITIQDVQLSSGAGFVVALTEKILTLPGLNSNPAAMSINLTDDGELTGIS